MRWSKSLLAPVVFGCVACAFSFIRVDAAPLALSNGTASVVPTSEKAASVVDIARNTSDVQQKVAPSNSVNSDADRRPKTSGSVVVAQPAADKTTITSSAAAAAAVPASADPSDSALPAAAPYDDVRPPTYDDIDLLLSDPAALSRAFGPAEAETPEDDVTGDDEATLQQLFTAGTRGAPTIADVDLSPLAMAEYLLATGDVRGLQQAVNDLVSAGLLTEEEASAYSDAVGAEYLTLVEQNGLMSRQQRAVYNSPELEDYSDGDEIVSPYASAPEYVDYNSLGGLLLPPGAEPSTSYVDDYSRVVDGGIGEDVDSDEQQEEDEVYLPSMQQYMERQRPAAVPAELVVDGRFLEELLLQQPRVDGAELPEPETQREAIEEEELEAEDAARLQNELEQAAASQPSASNADDTPLTIDDVSEVDNKVSLEAELESLPTETHAGQKETAEEPVDDEERQLERIGHPAENRVELDGAKDKKDKP